MPIFLEDRENQSGGGENEQDLRQQTIKNSCQNKHQFILVIVISPFESHCRREEHPKMPLQLSTGTKRLVDTKIV